MGVQYHMTVTYSSHSCTCKVQAEVQYNVKFSQSNFFANLTAFAIFLQDFVLPKQLKWWHDNSWNFSHKILSFGLFAENLHHKKFTLYNMITYKTYDIFIIVLHTCIWGEPERAPHWSWQRPRARNNGMYLCSIYPVFITPWFSRSMYSLKYFVCCQIRVSKGTDRHYGLHSSASSSVHSTSVTELGLLKKKEMN